MWCLQILKHCRPSSQISSSFTHTYIETQSQTAFIGLAAVSPVIPPPSAPPLDVKVRSCTCKIHPSLCLFIRAACSAQSLDAFYFLQVRDMMAKRPEYLDDIPKMPDFLVALRPHTVWEKTPVKLFCTVQGNPRPIVKWSEHPILTGEGFRLDLKFVLFKRSVSKSYFEVVTRNL